MSLFHIYFQVLDQIYNLGLIMTKQIWDYSISDKIFIKKNWAKCSKPSDDYKQKQDKRRVHTEITCSISYLDSISYIILDSTPPLSLPQIILVQTNTMKVALMPNPITVVTKFVPEPNISNNKNQPSTQKKKKKKLT